jgi:hypothetical protein
MGETTTPIRVGIEGVFYSLAHVPELVRFGSKPAREIAANSSLDERLTSRLRSFAAAVAYAPHQVFIGNLTPEELRERKQPWYENLIDGAVAQGRFGDLVGQESFYALLARADQFRLVGSTWSRCGKRYWRRGRNSKSVQDVQTVQIVIGSNSSDVLNGLNVLNDLNQSAAALIFDTAI